jgi:DNA-binding transcriptional LysR family regulator
MQGMLLRMDPSAMSTRSKANPETRLDDWNLLRSFMAVHELGTLTAAAEALRLTQPTLGRHIRELEALVGETLFDRLPGQMKPTQRAEFLMSRLQPLRDGIGSFEQALSGTGEVVAGTVRITSSQMFGALELPHLLAPLLREEALLQIEVQATDEVENLVRRDADIAVRFFRPEQDNVIALLVGQTELGLYASESFARTLPPGFTPSDLRSRFIGDIELERTLEIAASTGHPLQRQDFAYRTNASVGQLMAIEAGVGVGAMLAMFARRRPQLRRVLPELLSQPMGVWLCAHDDLRRSSRIRRVFDHLSTALRQSLVAEGDPEANADLGQG